MCANTDTIIIGGIVIFITTVLAPWAYFGFMMMREDIKLYRAVTKKLKGE